MHPTGSPEWGNEPERGVIGRGAVHQDEWRTCSFAPAPDRGAVSRAYPTSRPRSWRVLLCHETRSSISTPSPIRRLWSVLYAFVLTEDGGAPSRTHVGPDPRLSAAERMHLRGCNDVPMLGVNDVSIHHSRALGLTQYEPKPAGRAPDG